MTAIAIPSELQQVVTDLAGQGATVLLATLDDTGGYAAAPKRATVVWEIEGKKAVWTAAGNIDNGLFVLAIGRQHPLSEERWAQMKAAAETAAPTVH